MNRRRNYSAMSKWVGGGIARVRLDQIKLILWPRWIRSKSLGTAELAITIRCPAPWTLGLNLVLFLFCFHLTFELAIISEKLLWPTRWKSSTVLYLTFRSSLLFNFVLVLLQITMKKSAVDITHWWFILYSCVFQIWLASFIRIEINHNGILFCHLPLFESSLGSKHNEIVAPLFS